MEQKTVKATEPIIRLEHVRSMGAIGDPGCEGLGTYDMKVYAGALEETRQDGITLVVGDLVPAGTGRHYRAIRELMAHFKYLMFADCAELLERASNGERFSETAVYACPVCGYVITGDTPPERCLVCGGRGSGMKFMP